MYGQHTHFILNNFFFSEKVTPWTKVEEHGSVREATDDNIIWCKRIAW